MQAMNYTEICPRDANENSPAVTAGLSVIPEFRRPRRFGAQAEGRR